jgi:hypothetical protein
MQRDYRHVQPVPQVPQRVQQRRAVLAAGQRDGDPVAAAHHAVTAQGAANAPLEEQRVTLRANSFAELGEAVEFAAGAAVAA